MYSPKKKKSSLILYNLKKWASDAPDRSMIRFRK